MLKKRKKETAVDVPVLINDAYENREEALSVWTSESTLPTEENLGPAIKTESKADKRKGYVFCRKCYEVYSLRELKCPSCGYARSKN